MAQAEKRVDQQTVVTVEAKDRSAFIIVNERRGLIKGTFRVAPGKWDHLRGAIEAFITKMEEE